MRIVAAELEAGRPLNRIAIVYRQSEPYGADPRRGADGSWHPDARASGRHARAVGRGSHVARRARACGRRLRSTLRGPLDELLSAPRRRWLSQVGRMGPVGAARLASCAEPMQWTDRLGEQALDDGQAPLLAEYVAWLVDECGVDESRVVGRVGRLGARVPRQDARVGPGASALARARARRLRCGRAHRRGAPIAGRRRAGPGHSAGRSEPPRAMLVATRLTPRFVRLRGALRPTCVTSSASTSTRSSSLAWLRVSSRRLACDSAVLSSSERERCRVAVRAEPLGRETSAARTSPRSGPRRAGGCRVLEPASGQVAHEAPWLADAVGEQVIHRLVRRGAGRPCRSSRVVARARLAACCGRPISRRCRGTPSSRPTPGSLVGSPRSRLG